MKTNVSLGLLAMLMTGLFVLACDRDDLGSAPAGKVSLVFDNVVGGQDLTLNAGSYTNGAGERFSVSLFNYFVSNIRLKRTDGTEYVVPQDSSYFLVREADPASQTITLNNVPAGNYVGLSYLIGVDSLRSTMDISRRKGVLEPAGSHNGGMYWDWNSGYIFLKLEGTSPQAPADPTGANRFQYHVGFFGGYDTKTINNLRTVTLLFRGTDVAHVEAGQTPRISIQADVLRIFDGPAQVSISKNPNVMVSSYSATIASNYATMFRYNQLKTN